MATPATTKTVEELVAERPNENRSEAYSCLWGILTEFSDKIKSRFDLSEDPYSKQNYQPYFSVDGSQKGYMQTYTGPGMDWLMNSWVGNPETSFTNAHLNVWLGPETLVPHIAFVFGTVPDFFFYIDYVPRVDLQVNLDYLDKYFGPCNEDLCRMMNDTSYKPFFSQEHYMRIAMSPTALCFTREPSLQAYEEYRQLGHKYLDRWLEWIDDATPVPIDQRAALSHRDQLIRRYAIERDPVNSYSEKLLGENLAKDLIRTMWGGNRQLQPSFDHLNS